MGGEEAQARLLWDSGLRAVRWKLGGLQEELWRLLDRQRVVLWDRAEREFAELVDYSSSSSSSST